MPKGGNEQVRLLINRGLERYRRGELRDAVAQWEAALAADPRSADARALVEFGRGRLVGGADAERAEAAPVAFSEDWDAREPTNPEGADETAERVRRAELQAVKVERARHRRATVESPIPKLLAKLTDPEWDAEDAGAVPGGTVDDQETPVRAVTGPAHDLVTSGAATEGASAEGPPPEAGGAGPVPPADDARPSTPERGSRGKGGALRAARARAAELVERCRVDLRAGHVEAAAGVAEQALAAGEAAPEPGLDELLAPARRLFEQVFEAHVGPSDAVLLPAISVEDLSTMEIDARAGFLFSRLDGPLPVGQILDVAGMPRFEALRSLSLLLREGAVKHA